MKKIIVSMLTCSIVLSLFACGKKSVPEKMMLGGKEYDSKFVISGYYFDKASLSEATLGEMLEKVEIIEKPESLGEVTLPNFSTLELVNNKKEDITEQMIEAELEKERDGETVYVPVKIKRETKMTDKVTIDFKGFVDGVAFDGGEAVDYDLVLGSGAFIPGFEEQIVGHRAGSKFSIDVTFPEYYDPKLAGKDATFEITIKNMQEASTPEINEEFVKRHTEKGSLTVSEYKNEIKQRLEERDQFLNTQNLNYQLYSKLIEESKYNPTEEGLAWQFSVIVNQIKSQAAQAGMDFVSALSSNGGTISETFEEIKSSVPEYIKEIMVIDALMDKYDIKLTEEEVKTWFNTMSSFMGYGTELNYDDYKKYMGYDYLLNSAKQYKSLVKATTECKIIDDIEDEEE